MRTIHTRQGGVVVLVLFTLENAVDNGDKGGTNEIHTQRQGDQPRPLLTTSVIKWQARNNGDQPGYPSSSRA